MWLNPELLAQYAVCGDDSVTLESARQGHVPPSVATCGMACGVSANGAPEQFLLNEVQRAMHVKATPAQNLIRVANDITRAFEHACSDGDFEIASALLRTLEKMLPSDRKAFRDRRIILERLVSNHTTLWSLRNNLRARNATNFADAVRQTALALH